MSSHNLLSEEWCNLIFEGRNKDYGAYRIRKNMGRRYFVALCVVFSTVIVLTVLSVGIRYWWMSHLQNNVDELLESIPKMKMAEAEMGHEMRMIPEKVYRPRVVPKKEKGIITVPELVDEVTKEDIRLGFADLDAEEGDDYQQEQVDEDLLTSLEEADTVVATKVMDLPRRALNIEPSAVVDQMPEFPGGIGALMKWLDRHVAYPRNCIKLKIGGELQVTFLVDIDGTLHDARIVYSLHPDLDRSVLNAIRRMPKWKPGKLNGEFKMVSVTLPVHFQPR